MGEWFDTFQGVLPSSAKGLLTTRMLRLILSLLNVFCKDLKSLSEKRKPRGPAMGFSRGDQWGCLENELKMQFRHTPPLLNLKHIEPESGDEDGGNDMKICTESPESKLKKKKMLGVAAHFCNPRAGEAEKRGSMEPGSYSA